MFGCTTLALLEGPRCARDCWVPCRRARGAMLADGARDPPVGDRLRRRNPATSLIAGIVVFVDLVALGLPFHCCGHCGWPSWTSCPWSARPRGHPDGGVRPGPLAHRGLITAAVFVGCQQLENDVLNPDHEQTVKHPAARPDVRAARHVARGLGGRSVRRLRCRADLNPLRGGAASDRQGDLANTALWRAESGSGRKPGSAVSAVSNRTCCRSRGRSPLQARAAVAVSGHRPGAPGPCLRFRPPLPRPSCRLVAGDVQRAGQHGGQPIRRRRERQRYRQEWRSGDR